ncbi:Helix-loop-helix DNA-binding domain [Popillia japonica]|uniref:Helix-loop-helix DNA-binding domain n=1 Tax=Popillia japonica TaxID=7064 RepID=A0AAW1NJC0_POPJA
MSFSASSTNDAHDVYQYSYGTPQSMYGHSFLTGYNIVPVSSENDMEHIPTPYIRVVKRRNTANKKERRRTQSINNAYADLRDCIPNVPSDTKLSKIKTLRLATSYISYLTGVLETDDPAGGFRAELATSGRKSSNSHVQVNECSSGQISPKSDTSEDMISTRRAKGRTGWPQHVWALELKQEQTL